MFLHHIPTNSRKGPNISNTFASTTTFQSKATILDNMPSHNVTVGDIEYLHSSR